MTEKRLARNDTIATEIRKAVEHENRLHQIILDNNPQLRQVCEVWTRVMGYHRPTSSYNPGKKQEHEDRRKFVETKT